MPGSSRRPAVEALEEKAARIAAAIKGQPTADQVGTHCRCLPCSLSAIATVVGCSPMIHMVSMFGANQSRLQIVLMLPHSSLTCPPVTSDAAVCYSSKFHALKGDLDHLTSSLNPATCCGQQLSAAQTSSIPAALVQTAMVGLELLGKAASAASEAAQTLSDALDQLGKPLLYFVSAAAVTGHSLTALPPGAQGLCRVSKDRLQPVELG